MRHVAPALCSLQCRLLALLVLVVAVALGTVAVVARVSTTAEFARYVETSRHDLQSVAQQIAASTGERLLVTTGQGRVIVDSSGELIGQSLTLEQAHALGLVLPAPPAPGTQQEVSADVVFVRRSATSSVSPGGAVWTRPLPPGMRVDDFPAGVLPIDPIGTTPLIEAGVSADDREQVFLTAVTRSLLVGVLVGGVAAVVLGVLFARGVLRPVGMLTAAARRMERGDLSQRVPVTSGDEIGHLARAFNAMADALARNEHLRRTMVGDVAHELRTPLTNLRGYLEALKDGVTQPRGDMIDSLYEEALLLTHLVDDLQDLALSDAGRLSLRPEPFDAVALLRASALALSPRARQQGVELRVESVADLPLVHVDPQRIGQVVRNLVSNALTYTPAGGSVRLSAQRCGEMVRIDVRDNGSGIAPEHLPNVFERFYRADASRSRATGGAGIGLALVKQFVTAHGGSVGVTSAPGRGSCFSFTLPICPG